MAGGLGNATTPRPHTLRHIPVLESRAALWVEAARAYAHQGRLASGCQVLRIAETCEPGGCDAQPSGTWSPTWQPGTVDVRCRSSTTSAADWESPL